MSIDLSDYILALTEEDIGEERMKEALTRPSDMGYFGKLPLFDTWSLGPVIRTRDSDPVVNCNADTLIEMMEERFGEPADPEEDNPTGVWAVQGFRHHLVGWVEHLSFQVLNTDNEASDVFRVIMAANGYVRDHLVLDPDKFDEMQELMENYDE
tara:strand:+ start:457 stop:918 length:462 start_codon:yes stop_codon:yes gene_type:complete